ncbi:hypothetical protein [Streptomyces sp. NPDC001500]
MNTNPTALLLDLAAQAQHLSDHDTLHRLLAQGHQTWCEGIADVRSALERQTAHIADLPLAQRCAAAGSPWERDMSRSEAVGALAFALWDASPAAIAYTELEDHAAAHGVCLLPEQPH